MSDPVLQAIRKERTDPWGLVDDVIDPTATQIEQYFRHSPEAAALYRGLRREYFPDPHPTIGHLGAHSMRAVRAICELAKPKHVLEIGFNMGHSAEMWLYFAPEADLTAVDLVWHPDVLKCVVVAKERHPHRFRFYAADSLELWDTPNYEEFQARRFDLIFVDGDHSKAGVSNDLKLASALKIRWIVLDDYWRIWGAGTQDALAETPYQILRRWGNIVLIDSYA